MYCFNNSHHYSASSSKSRERDSCYRSGVADETSVEPTDPRYPLGRVRAPQWSRDQGKNRNSGYDHEKNIDTYPILWVDPTEVAIPWKLISEKDLEIVFITPEGKKASADSLMLKGEKLRIWKSVLRARQDAVDAYYEMEKNKSFYNPLKYIDVQEESFDAIGSKFFLL